MSNFFELHDEKIIGYKALTLPDLGLQPTSHQTHIGLFDDVLTFLPDKEDIEDSAMFIYNSEVVYLNLYFNRIQNPDGSFRSPKIITGGRNTVSIVTAIRNIVKNEDKNLIWYLFWFGLKNEQTVFWLFNNKSKTFTDITSMGLELNESCKGRIVQTDRNFQSILNYIENNLDRSSFNIQKELEIEAQIPGKLITEHKIRRYDIIRAQERFAQIGKMGEEFVAEYFEKLKHSKKIISYNWVNKNQETGYPYDFTYQDLSDNVIYLDVKSTPFDFEQKIIYSNREVEFAQSQINNCYNIFRVYNLTESNAKLKICKCCNPHFENIHKNVISFKGTLNHIETDVQNISMAFRPTLSTLHFGQEILLEKV